MNVYPVKKVIYSVSTDIDDESQFTIFKNIIKETLNSPKGWNKFNFEFQEIPHESSHRDNLNILEINLINKKNISGHCGTLNGLSCYDPNIHSIFIHSGNWNGESESTMPINRYRNYVINHEVGHALGLLHPSCPVRYKDNQTNQPKVLGSVMQQMTKGPQWIAKTGPCVENEWPRDDEFKLQNKEKLLYKTDKIYQGGSSFLGLNWKLSLSPDFIIVISLIVMVIYFLFITSDRNFFQKLVK